MDLGPQPRDVGHEILAQGFQPRELSLMSPKEERVEIEREGLGESALGNRRVLSILLKSLG